MRWLITGGAGFIGRSLIENLLAEGGHEIRILDNLTVGTRDDLAGSAPGYTEIAPDADFSNWGGPVSLVVGDILDAELAKAASQGAEIMIHLAANTGVGPSVEDPMSDCLTNVIGTVNMLEACRTQQVGRFVFASSGAPLGVQTPPLNEEMAPHPASPYGASKLAGEGYCSAYYHSFGIDTVGLRFGNVYGEGSGKKNSVVAKFIKQAMAGEPLEIYGDGGQTRDFIHISDLIAAVRAAAATANVGGELFQIATATERTVSELTERLVAAMVAEGLAKPTIVFGPSRTGDVARNYSDTQKAAERLGWRTHVQLEDGLRRTVQYFTATETD